MRHFLAGLVLFSLCLTLGCGGGSGVQNATQADVERAGGNMAGDTYDGPSPQRTPPSTAANNPRPGTEGTTSAAANSQPARPTPTGPTLADEGSNLPVQPKSNANSQATENKPATAESRPARPSSGAQLAGEGDNLPVTPSTGAANLASESDNPPASSAAPTSAASGAAVGRKGGGRGTTVTAGGAGVAGGKGAGGAVPSDNLAPSEAAPEPSTPAERAAKSFKEFREFDGTQHLYAFWLTEDGAMSEYPIQWVKGLAEPRLFFRWGVGVVYDAPTDFSGQPPLIGDPLAPSNSSTRTGGGRNGRAGAMLNETASSNASQSPYANVDQTTPLGNLLYYTGDFGERLVKRLDARRLHKEHFYGKILAISQLKDSGTSQSDSVTATITNPGVSAPQHAILLDETQSETTRTVTTNTGPRNSRNTSGVVATTGTLIPGVLFLGVESDENAEQALLDRGKTAGVDAMIIFYVSIKSKSRSSAPYNTTSVGVHNLTVADSKPHKTGSLSSETVAKFREREKDADDDPVEVNLDKIFAQFSDDTLRLSPIPDSLNADVAKKRVDTLAAGTYDNPLPVVVEILSYRESKLIDDATASAALGKVLGGDDVAQTLLKGSAQDKLAAIEKWLPGAEGESSKADPNFR